MTINSSRLLAVLLIFAPALSLYAQGAGSMEYTVSMAKPATHTYHVVFRCAGIDQESMDLKMPAWTPGYYQILDYGKNLENFRARDGKGKDLSWEKADASTWRVRSGRRTRVTVEYDIKATVSFVAQSWLDTTRGNITPASVFLYVDGLLHHPVTVVIQPYPGWDRAATGLDTVAGKKFTFQAADLDVLYDSPILIGQLETLPPFYIKGIPHYFTGYQLGDFDRRQFIEDLQKVVEAGIAVIGDIPYRSYTFLAIGPGRGGIEHLNSTTIGFSGKDLGKPGGRQRVLQFIAHEYFHHYNVKRIRPIALGPFDYQHENRTNMLWVSEGLTVYYEYLMLQRAGLMTGEAMLQGLQSDMASYENSTGHLYQSLTQASYETWSDGPFGRKGDPVNKTISYYEKGPVVGALLDLAIRHATEDRRSLDDVMRALYHQYYQEQHRGFTDEEFRQTCERIAGVGLAEVFSYASTVNDPDYAKYFGYAGLGVERKDKVFRIYPLPNPDDLQGKIRRSWIGE